MSQDNVTSTCGRGGVYGEVRNGRVSESGKKIGEGGLHDLREQEIAGFGRRGSCGCKMHYGKSSEVL